MGAPSGARSADRPVEVVVLGGGYVGVWGTRAMARRLRGPLRRGEVRVTVVSASTTHAFHGWTGEVLAGVVDHDRTRTPLAGLVRGARLVHGRAVSVDVPARTVAVDTADGRQDLPWDHLVVGFGTVDATAVPGLANHGHVVKGEWALAATDAHLDEVVRRAAETDDAEERRRLLTVVIAGGGFAGVEMAAAIAERLSARRTLPDDADPAGTPIGPDVRVVLVHGGGHLLAEVRPRLDRLADYATRQLADAGVEVRRNTRLVAVAPAGAVLDGDGGHEDLPAGTVISTVGQQAVPLAGTDALPRDPAGRLVTDAWLRTPVPGLWAGGDAAAVPHVLGRRACPPNALWAIKHGNRVGDNVARAIRGRRLRRFRFLGLGLAASLGIGRGAVELAGVTLTGWPGWLARWAFFHAFMPSRRQAVATIADWLLPSRRGRDDARVVGGHDGPVDDREVRERPALVA